MSSVCRCPCDPGPARARFGGETARRIRRVLPGSNGDDARWSRTAPSFFRARMARGAMPREELHRDLLLLRGESWRRPSHLRRSRSQPGGNPLPGGCAEDRPPIEFVQDERSGLEGIEVTGRSWKELNGSMAFGSRSTTRPPPSSGGVRGGSQRRVSLRARSAGMVYGGGSRGRGPPLGRSTLRPNESLEVRGRVTTRTERPGHAQCGVSSRCPTTLKLC